MPYDIAAITREIQTEFGLFRALTRGAVEIEPPKNKATPEGLRALLDALKVVTDEVIEGRNVWGILDEHEVAFDLELQAWRERLAMYFVFVTAAPPGDRQAVLWNVTAPLLLGYFGGETATSPQQPLDAVTPFVLSNMLAVSVEAEQRAWDLFLEDLKENAAKLPKAGSDLLKAVGIIAAAVVVASLAR